MTASERWAQRLQRHLEAEGEADLGVGPYWAEPGGGIDPAARWAYEDLADRGLLHSHVDHVRSSQAFALNLFAPLDQTSIVALLQEFAFDVVEADPPRFEWEDRHDRLHEATATRPHRTQVDVVLRGRTSMGRTIAVLVEVKLSETDLNHCSAYDSAHNDTRHNCQRTGLFGADPNACFQLRNRDLGPRRSYDTTLKGSVVQPTGAGCAVRGGANQAMRNLALAHLVAGDTDEEMGDSPQVFFALCAPLAHRAMWRRWNEIEALFPGPRLRALPADEVVVRHTPARRDRLATRYLLQPAEPAVDERVSPPLGPLPEVARWDNEWPDDAWRELASWHIATALSGRHPGRYRVIETHPGGGQYDCLSLYPADTRAPDQPIHINRVGSIHLAIGNPTSAIRGVWERLAAVPDIEALIVQLEHQGAIRPAGPTEPNAAHQLITTVLTATYTAGRPYQCLNGYADTSSYGGGIRQDLFDQIPGSTALLDDQQPDDFEGGPAYRCWFLGPAAGPDESLRPTALVESTGHLIYNDGTTGIVTAGSDLRALAATIGNTDHSDNPT